MGALRAILFDLHDTLVAVPGDNLVERRRAGFEVLRAVTGATDFPSFCAADDAARASLYPPGNPDLLDFGVTRRFQIATRQLLGKDLPSEFLCRMVEAYVDAWIDTLLPLPGTTEALELLGRDYRLAIVSDYGDVPGLHRILDRFGLAGRFDPIVVSVEVGRMKPHPAMFSTALERLRLGPSEVVHVGDNPVCDVEGARRSGIRPILMDYAGLHPDCSVERIEDLRELAGLLNVPSADPSADGADAPDGKP